MNAALAIAVKAAVEGGAAIMDIYSQEDLGVVYKDDDSPLTLADKKCNDVINSFLIKTPHPIISEENRQLEYQERKDWNTCWIVDPLDGTKEFVKRNGEFTVNIALVKQGKPLLGVIYVPDTKELYVADVAQNQCASDLIPSPYVERVGIPVGGRDREAGRILLNIAVPRPPERADRTDAHQRCASRLRAEIGE